MRCPVRAPRQAPKHLPPAGLVFKSRDARLFLRPGLCTRCDVVEESATHLVRDATIGGQDLREIIVFEPQRKVSFS